MKSFFIIKVALVYKLMVWISYIYSLYILFISHYVVIYIRTCIYNCVFYVLQCVWPLASKNVPVNINHIVGLTMPSGCLAQSGRGKPALP